MIGLTISLPDLRFVAIPTQADTMNFRKINLSLTVIILLGCCFPYIQKASNLTDSKNSLTFNRDIRPILSKHCFPCHGFDAKNRKADLRLDIAEMTLDASDKQPAIIPGKPEESAVWLRVTSTDADEIMPPPEAHKELTDIQKETLKQWIEQGAQYETHWSFITPSKPGLPGTASIENPIDAFVLARLESANLMFTQSASKETLIRRVTLDLTGLPPTPEEVDAFLGDNSPVAYDTLVTSLLNRFTFGEHMARYWLDLARYADTHGLHLDNERSMWPYRDWVVRAFNQNLPFDTFTIWQLAGDLLPEPTRDQLIASGFNRCNVSTGEGGSIKPEWIYRNAVDRTNTAVEVWMGMTAGCATCHDHKFDPLSTKDYYSMYAFFHSAADPPLDGNVIDTPPILRLSTPEEEQRLKELDSQLEAINHRVGESNPEEEGHEALKEEQKAMKEKRDAFRKTIPLTFVMADLPEARESFVMERGIYDKPGEKVFRNVPSFLPPLPEKNADRDYNRLDFAQWLVNGKHPLTARVTVNRLWQQFFGKGLVETSADFGTQGQVPSHPALLDWLAVQFIEDGWNIKRMIQRIVTSDAYRRHSKATPEMIRLDPENRLLARGPRLRLDAEVLRDQALFVSGLLVPMQGGRGVHPYQPPNIWEPVGFGSSNTRYYKQGTGTALYRRSLYTFFKRTAPPPFMASFDAPNREQSCTVRGRSNTPLQALQLMNDIQHVEAARQLGARALREGGDSDHERLRWAWRVMTARYPHPDELSVLQNTLNIHRDRYASDPGAATELLAYGDSSVDASLNAVELAAYTLVANLMLNLDESVNKN